MTLTLLIAACVLPEEPPRPANLDPPGALVGSERQRDLDPDVDPETIAELSASNRAFALELYDRLASGTDDNLFFSPHSVSLALAMAYAGAEGPTEAEMAAALHLDLAEPRLHRAFNALDLALAEREDFRLEIVNQPFAQMGTAFEPPFLDTLAVHYGAAMRLLDFQGDPEGARERINAWVEATTGDRIEDLLPPGSVDELTRLVLANAITFRAPWKVPFDPTATVEGSFERLDGTVAQVPMMRHVLDAVYASGDGWALAELPYVGDELAMGVLVPDAGRFREIEAGLDAAFVDDALADLQTVELTLGLPKFSFTSELDLVPALRELGMVRAFTGDADFSGMSTEVDLAITGVHHQAFVAVDEAGTEAAAATGVVVGVVSAPPPVRLWVDRPFLVWIRDRPTGALLFLGRVTEP